MLLAAARRDIDPEIIDLYKATRIDLSTLPEICTTDELAPAIRMSVGALNQDRYMRRGLPYLKIGRRIRYSRAAVAQYLLANYQHHAAV